MCRCIPEAKAAAQCNKSEHVQCSASLAAVPPWSDPRQYCRHPARASEARGSRDDTPSNPEDPRED
ncbi:MAG: hypothetical protein HPY84_09000 [Syntrophobacteraceae bacterium]|nr:hypothetical protein [Syntrophobacteraceae bacterium]